MKLCLPLITFVFLSSVSSAQMHITQGLTYAPKMYCSIDFEVKPWTDSTRMKFLVVTVKKSVLFDTISTSSQGIRDLGDYYYWNLNSFSILQEGSSISPIRYLNSTNFDTLNNPYYTRIMQGLFLVDEVNTTCDSIELVMHTQSGYMLQNLTTFYDESVTLHFNPTKEIDRRIPRATNKWYRKLLNHEPNTKTIIH